MLLFINACVRKSSRTERLARHLLSKMSEGFAERRIGEINFPVADESFLLKRDELLKKQNYDHPMFDLAREFASANEIVIAAPYWDLSFPAALKQYFEQINALGITFKYTPQGVPQGLCRAKRLTYVTTAGGVYCPEEFGFGYVKALCQGFYGIADVRQIKATGLDIDGADAEGILKEAMREAEENAV